MIDRTPEEELMEDAAQAKAYAAADFSKSNQSFVDRFLDLGQPGAGWKVVDLGCGPAEIPIRLVKAHGGINITAVDGSAAMIALAKKAVASAGKDAHKRIELLEGCIPGLPLAEHSFDAIISNSLLHQLHEPAGLWREVKRLGRSGAVVYCVDLFRPKSEAEAKAIVERTAAREPEILKTDYLNSLLAAFSIEEIQSQLDAEKLNLTIEKVSDRHIQIFGRL